MKKFQLLLAIFFTLVATAQKNTDYTFGKITQDEVNLKNYQVDTTANALVLYETGNTKFMVIRRRVMVVTKYYYKIKIFNQEGFKHGTFEIPLYNNERTTERITDVQAVTHNGYSKAYLNKKSIYTEKINERWSASKFTMPNLKEGSIIEVEYTIESPFKFNLTGWEFQSDIPKLLSEYKASIPGNYVYNRQLIGYLKLKTNSATVKKECFRVQGYAGYSNCENVHYSIENIPAFKEEDYMTDGSNFISKIKFELAETIWFDGRKQKYTTTWKATDKEFRTDKNIGVQLKKTNLFKEFIPTKIRSIENDLDKAKAIYTFIQNHFSWNEKYSIFKNVKVKNAIENSVGNVGEINIALINAMNSVGINTELVLISTRNNGLPTKLYPVISDFNYVIAKVNINGSFYLLDATEKQAQFGLLPFRCLNSYGRVMDFKNDSYWIDIDPKITSSTQFYASLIMEENGIIKGKLRKVSFGYDAFYNRKNNLHKDIDAIISDFESRFTDLSVLDYNIENKEDLEKPTIENIEILLESTENFSTWYFNPFFTEKQTTNPFKQENRLYPVDFGYTRKSIVFFNMVIPDNYKIDSYPLSKNIILKDGGFYKLFSQKNNDYKFSLKSSFVIKKSLFYNHEYHDLKELFKQVIISQKTPIALKKLESLPN